MAKLDELHVVAVGAVREGFRARCEKESAEVRSCMKNAATKRALDACDEKSTLAFRVTPEAPRPLLPLVVHDLSPAGPTWKGWSAKAPQDAKATPGSPGEAVLKAESPAAFAIWFNQGATDLEAVKAGALSGNNLLGVAITPLVDTPDKFEWMMESGGAKRWFLSWIRKVGGVVVRCTTIAGVGSQAELDQLKVGCASLAKK